MFKTSRVLVVSTFVFLLNKNRYKNKCGGDLSKSPIANSFVISPPTCCTSSTLQHAEGQDRWNPVEDGRTSGSTRPPLNSLSSQLFFLYKRWYVQHIPHKLPKFLSLNEFHCWSQKLNSKNLANPPYALQALSWINLHTLYSLHSF